MSARLQVGDRVRMTAHGRDRFARRRSYTGVVTGGAVHQGLFYPRVHCDGYKRSRGVSHPSFWELIPPSDLSLDAVATLLARAVLTGDATAARPLADRVFELCGATPGGAE